MARASTSSHPAAIAGDLPPISPPDTARYIRDMLEACGRWRSATISGCWPGCWKPPLRRPSGPPWGPSPQACDTRPPGWRARRPASSSSRSTVRTAAGLAPLWRTSSSISTGAGPSNSAMRPRMASASASICAVSRTAAVHVRCRPAPRRPGRESAAAPPGCRGRSRSVSRPRGSGGWCPWRADRAASRARRKFRGPVRAHSWP